MRRGQLLHLGPRNVFLLLLLLLLVLLFRLPGVELV